MKRHRVGDTGKKCFFQETWPSNNVIWDNFSSERFLSACAFKIRHLQSQNLHKLMTHEETFQNWLMKTSFLRLPTKVSRKGAPKSMELWNLKRWSSIKEKIFQGIVILFYLISYNCIHNNLVNYLNYRVVDLYIFK